MFVRLFIRVAHDQMEAILCEHFNSNGVLWFAATVDLVPILQYIAIVSDSQVKLKAEFFIKP